MLALMEIRDLAIASQPHDMKVMINKKKGGRSGYCVGGFSFPLSSPSIQAS